MINIKSERISKTLENAHKKMVQKFNTNSEETDRFILCNQLIALLCLYPDAGPMDLSRYMYEKYACIISADDIIIELRKNRLGNPKEREPLFQWTRDMVGLFGRALSGDQSAFYKFAADKNIAAPNTGSRRNERERILLMGIFTLLNEIDVYGDYDKLFYNGNVKARYCLYDFEDAIASAYGFKMKKGKRNTGNVNEENKTKLTYEQALAQIAELETVLERTNAMLKDLQDEFDEQIAESKTQELTEFFSKLNSDRYGRILDELFMLRKGISVLRTQNYEVPKEIDGLMIMAIKLLQFVKESHIDPIMKVNSIKMVKASDIDACNYDGSPFADNNEIKKVRVMSPGWVYRDKEIQISRPQLKEEK